MEKTMNYLFVITVCLVLGDNGGKCFNIFPNPQMGRYEINFKNYFKCKDDSNSELQLNFYLDKTSNTTLLRGNITSSIRFDDSLMLNINMAAQDTYGRWEDNAHVFRIPKACMSLNNLMGHQWNSMFSAHGIKDANCPINAGVYVSNGCDLKNVVSSSKFSKTFFYGTYKVRLYFTDKFNVQHGCGIFIVKLEKSQEAN